MRGRVGSWIDRTRRRSLPALAIAASAAAMLATTASAASDSTAVSFGGDPLTVYVGPRGQCQSSYLFNGKTEGNFYPGGQPYQFSPVGDCGFFLAFPKSGSGQPAPLQGKTFGFEGHAPQTSFSEAYTPVSQSPVSGDGSSSNPLTQTTKFSVGSGVSEAAAVTETTTYVNGSPQFTSTFAVKNTSAGEIYFRAIYAGDLFVNGDDQGVGVLLGGPPRFIGGQNTASGVLGGLQEASSPALNWSSFEELAYPNIWTRIAASDDEAEAFKGKIEGNEVDNAVGVEWDQFRSEGLKEGAEATFSIVNRTQVPSGLGIQPVSQSRTVGQTATVTVTASDTAGSPYANRPLVYNIGGANPKSGSVTTNASGVATIGYVGTAAGLDTMQMFLDLAATGSQAPQDPASTAQVTWVAASPSPPSANGGYRVQSVHAKSDGTITIVFVPTQDGTATLEVTVPTATISRQGTIAASKKKCKRNQIRIKGRCNPKTTVSGKLSAKGKAGVALKLTVKPSRRVKRALKRGRKVQLTAKLTYKSLFGGKPVTQTFHLTVRPPKGKKPH